MKLKNIFAVLKDQMPLKRFIRNFFITRNAWGLFHINSHIRADTGMSKVSYGTKMGANAAAVSIGKKFNKHYSTYKCLHCDGFHIGKNRDNK